jgi:hypothetical protein
MLARFNELFLEAFGEFFLALALGLVEKEGIDGMEGIAGKAANAGIAGKAGIAGIGGNAEAILSAPLPGTSTMIATERAKIVAPIITKGA